MKTIRIKFVGFWPEFKEDDNFIINILKKYYNVCISEEPEYLFSSCFSEEYLNYDCIRIFYTGENLCPDFNLFDYAIGYEYIDYLDRYLRYPNFAIPEIYGQDCALMCQKHKNADNAIKEKTEFCAFVVSKGKGYVAPERESFFLKLSQYKKVNSGGRFLNNINEPNGVKDKLEFQKKHKFVIAFENSSHPGYSTEKIVQAFAAGAIPIYWGDPLISRLFNEDAFVNCHSFNSWDDVIEEVKRIDNNDAEYKDKILAPALQNEDFLKEYNSRLEKFLLNIMEQDIENAYRRDAVGYGKMKEDRIKQDGRLKETRLYKICSRIIG